MVRRSSVGIFQSFGAKQLKAQVIKDVESEEEDLENRILCVIRQVLT